MAVELLTKFNPSQRGKWLKQDETLLVETYRASLDEEEELLAF
jgi:hypothetical protein